LLLILVTLSFDSSSLSFHFFLSLSFPFSCPCPCPSDSLCPCPSDLSFLSFFSLCIIWTSSLSHRYTDLSVSLGFLRLLELWLWELLGASDKLSNDPVTLSLSFPSSSNACLHWISRGAAA
jgi:hypothetical protein